MAEPTCEPTTDDGWVTFYVTTHPNGRNTVLTQKRDGSTRTVIR